MEVYLCCRPFPGSEWMLLVDPDERLKCGGPTCHCEGAKYGSYIKEMQPETTSLLVIADNNLTYPDLHWRHKIAFFPKPQFPLPPHFHPLLSHSLGYEPR